MKDLSVTILLEPKLFKENRKITWAYSTLNIYKPYVTCTIMALICLVIGVSTEGGKKYPVGIILGGGLLIYLLFAWIGLIEQWRAFDKVTKLHMALYAATPQSCTYTFTDEDIMYEDNQQLVKLNWDLLTTYNVYKSTIIIRAKNQKQVLFSIGKYQIDHEVYNQVRSILDEKVG